MKVSAIQFEHNDLYSKKERISKAVSQIRSCNSDLILLPELWNTGFFSYDNYKQNAETIDGETIASISDIAKEKKCYILSGSFIEKENNSLYNTSVLINPKGELVIKYRKIHLFGLESDYLTAGNKVTVAETDLGIVGISICYDLRFPELYRKMSEQGVNLILSSYALPIERAKHWDILTPARALENQSFFVSCGCTGTNNKNTFAGGSLIVSPYGDVLKKGKASFEIVSSEIDINEAIKYKKDFPVQEHRKVSNNFM